MKKVILLSFASLLVSAGISGQGLFESSLSENSNSTLPDFISIGGFIRSGVYIGETTGEEDLYLQSAYAQASLQLRAKAGTKVSAFTDIRFRTGTEWQEKVSEIDLREAYLALQTGPVGFRFGKQILPWGKGSVYNPVNKLTPMDPTTRSPEVDDMNLGIWALQGSLNLGNYLQLAATWNPLYQPGKLLIDPIPMPEYVRFLDPDYPDVQLDEGSYGISLDLRAPLMDAALYWFQGYHNWPGIAFDSFIMDESMVPLALNLYEKAYRIRMAGLDLSIPVGSWIISAEAAWFRATDDHESAEYIPFPEWSYTAEIEKTFSRFTVIAGYYGKYILDYTPSAARPELAADQEQFLSLIEAGIELSPEIIAGAIEQQIGAFNRLYNYQLEEFYHSSYLVLRSDFFHKALELEVPVIYNFTTREWTARPAISWLPADGVRIKAGYSGMWGADNSLYDLVGPVLNAGFIAMTLTF